ncbi:MAG: hypothetical protein WBA89_10835 [Microcoleus sp.]|uniref:hypothetical protein n=1 Tax=unclassified Microcoleus TaxID=2642155 RepID=UPI001D141F36|nr:hypothetical protein [Microcoleus sp. LEGE 07076]
MTSIKEILKSVQFVVDANGKKKAAQLSISAWEALIDWIEDREDEQIFLHGDGPIAQMRWQSRKGGLA